MEKKSRLTVDLTEKQHMQLVILATKRKMTIKEYVIEALALKESIDKNAVEANEDIFNESLSKILNKRRKLITALAKK